jgi:3-hydroxyisobutyrate dehydrogenase-like beta-hydroxyacid dehydrogenase
MRLGFVGLGRMGTPMCQRLLDAGHQLVVTDVDAGATGRVSEFGAEVAASAAEVADRCEIVLASLPTPEAVREVALGTDGVVAGEQVRHFVDLSTTGAPTAQAVAAGLAERGITAVDAPVSGGVSGAVKGTLAVMVACAEADFATVEPILGVIGRVFHVAQQPGLGQVMKLANNYLSAAAIALTSEAMVVGTKAGLNPHVMIDVLNASSGRNSATQDKFPKAVLPRTFDFGFATGLMDKDLRLFAEEASELDIPLPIEPVLRQLWEQSNDRYGEASDFTNIAKLIEDHAHVTIEDPDQKAGG